MIEQIICVLLGVVAIAILDSIGSILSRKLNFNYMLLTFVSIAIYSSTSICVASIGNTHNGILAGSFLGLFDATIGILIARKFKPNIGTELQDDFEWKINFNMVMILVVFAMLISTISIYIYNKII